MSDVNDLYKQAALVFVVETDLIYKTAAFDFLEGLKNSFGEYLSGVKDNFNSLKQNPREITSRLFNPNYPNMINQYNQGVSTSVDRAFKPRPVFGIQKSWASSIQQQQQQ